MPFFLINLIIVAVIFAFLDISVSMLPSLVASNFSGISWVNIAYAIVILTIAIFTNFLLKIFFQATITDHASYYWKRKKRSLSKSFPSFSRYLSVLFALIIAGIISVVVSSTFSLLPAGAGLLSTVASIILGLIFLLLIQIIVISKKGAIDSIKIGYKIFRKDLGDVLGLWLILLLVSIVLVAIAFIPLVIAAIPIIAPLIGSLSGDASVLATLIPLIKANMLPLLVASIISAFVMAYMAVFQESAKTFFYMQKKKR
jgi:hypothetical protein